MLKTKLIIREPNQPIDDAINDFLQNHQKRATRFQPAIIIKKISYAFDNDGMFKQAIIEYDIKE